MGLYGNLAKVFISQQLSFGFFEDITSLKCEVMSPQIDHEFHDKSI